MKWLGRLLLVMVVAALGVCAGVVYAGFRLTSAVRTQVGPPPAGLPGAERVTFDAADGATLQGWWTPGRPGGGVVVLIHGWGGNRRDMLTRARRLESEGFGALLFDLEAHGESNGDKVTFGPREGEDAAAAIAWVRQRAPGAKIGAIGQSLGGAALLLGPRPAEVDAMVLESVYPTIGQALRHRLDIHLTPQVTALLMPLFETIVPPVLGLRVQDARPIDRIGQVRAPILVANGADDDRTPLVEAQTLFDRAPPPKQFWPVPGVGHDDLEEKAPDAYWRTVLPFLVKYLRP